MISNWHAPRAKSVRISSLSQEKLIGAGQNIEARELSTKYLRMYISSKAKKMEDLPKYQEYDLREMTKPSPKYQKMVEVVPHLQSKHFEIEEFERKPSPRVLPNNQNNESPRLLPQPSKVKIHQSQTGQSTSRRMTQSMAQIKAMAEQEYQQMNGSLYNVPTVSNLSNFMSTHSIKEIQTMITVREQKIKNKQSIKDEIDERLRLNQQKRFNHDFKTTARKTMYVGKSNDQKGFGKETNIKLFKRIPKPIEEEGSLFMKNQHSFHIKKSYKDLIRASPVPDGKLEALGKSYNEKSFQLQNTSSQMALDAELNQFSRNVEPGKLLTPSFPSGMIVNVEQHIQERQRYNRAIKNFRKQKQKNIFSVNRKDKKGGSYSVRNSIGCFPFQEDYQDQNYMTQAQKQIMFPLKESSVPMSKRQSYTNEILAKQGFRQISPLKVSPLENQQIQIHARKPQVRESMKRRKEMALLSEIEFFCGQL